MVKFDTHRWCATAVFVVALIVYAFTMADTVSFWDCGEFAACAYTMAVPHPPGSPLFLLVGRVFSLIPISSDIGVRVTFMSVLASAFSILFAYLIIVRLVRFIRGSEKTAADKIIAYSSGIIGSLSLAWSYSMWFNAVESEVYAMSQFFTHIVIWLILVWHEKADEPGNERWLLLIAYMVGLSTGVHLLNILALPAIALVMYFRHRKFQIGTFIGMAAITGLIFIVIYPGVVKWLPLSASKISMWAPAIIFLGIIAVFWWAAKKGHGITGIAMAGLFLIIVGYSAYAMIYIRSHLNPGIDENDPDTPARFFSYLNREQYGDRPMFPRIWNNDPEYRSESDYFWRYQVNKMFNRYLFWQFIGRQDAPQREYQDAGVSPKYSIISLFKDEPTGGIRWLAIITCVPFILGLIGFGYQFTRDKKGWIFIAALFFMTGYAIILYLNQDNPQPRERDYSYCGAFFAFTLWIGLGAAAVMDWVAKYVKEERASRSAVLGAAVLLLLLSPTMLLAKNYSMNDRSGNYVAWDYSYNMLMSCAKNGIIFTNGDNDTFPVWYLQEVDRVRRDVRLVNLSLLNTGWYIKQLKHRDPQVPISFNDQYIDRYLDQHDAPALMARHWPTEKQKVELNTPDGKMVWTVPASMYVPMRQGESRQNNFLRVQDIMILDILRTNYDPAKTTVPKPVYFAVTVANSNMVGLRDFLTFEGLVFRINPKGRQPVDADLLRKNLLETFKGHFRGINDPSVHYDDNIEKLLQNYRSSFLQLAYYFSTLPDTDPNAGSQYESLDQRITHFDKLSNRQKALTVMLQLDQLIPEAVRPISNPDLTLQVGKMYADLGRPDELKRRLDMLDQRTDLRFETHARIAGFLAGSLHDTEQAARILDKALGTAPTAEQYYAAGRELFGTGSYMLAARYFEKTLSANPNDGQAIGALLQAYENLGDRTQARTALQNWISRHPQDKGAQQRLDQLLAEDTTRPNTTN
ncbi:DUF2723 domain-containing protein [candidate division KSB1 bacterium]|nr:MAG: DUF2723 domain-containing protein [candidate division KSB1 bacterium]